MPCSSGAGEHFPVSIGRLQVDQTPADFQDAMGFVKGMHHAPTFDSSQ